MRNRVWFHRASALVWAALLVPALLWWSESVLFVIIASVYANVKSDWTAAEAADDRQLVERLDRIESLLVGGLHEPALHHGLRDNSELH